MRHPIAKSPRSEGSAFLYLAIRRLISASDAAPLLSPNASQASEQGTVLARLKAELQKACPDRRVRPFRWSIHQKQDKSMRSLLHRLQRSYTSGHAAAPPSNVMNSRRPTPAEVLAGFDPQWPDLNFTVAGFGMEQSSIPSVSNRRLTGGDHD